ncbi:MAG: tetratricopeptide repeat protein, partial [Chthoniobacterales bacterium]
EAAFAAALREFEEHPGALLGMASVRLALHRFAEAEALAEQVRRRAPRNAEARLLASDAWLALGRTGEATKLLDGMEERPAVLARRAEVARLQGKNEEAVRLCAHAAEAAGARGEAPIDIAVSRVRLGEMFFRSGKLEAADEQYRLARELAPESFTVLEHRAELLGAQEKFSEAVALYQQVIAQSYRPDMEQALGDLFTFMKQPERARLYYDRALAGYLASVERGEIHFIHHLAGFYCDAQEDGVEAVKWARQDLALRQSATAHESVAWALYRAGEFEESRREIEAALASGIKDAHVIYHAGLIFSAAGDLEHGRKLLEETATLNPSYLKFHVHR